MAVAAVLAGCATDPNASSRYQTEMSRLETQCREREGILTPTGAASNNPAVEYACMINGVATRLR